MAERLTSREIPDFTPEGFGAVVLAKNLRDMTSDDTVHLEACLQEYFPTSSASDPNFGALKEYLKPLKDALDGTIPGTLEHLGLLYKFLNIPGSLPKASNASPSHLKYLKGRLKEFGDMLNQKAGSTGKGLCNFTNGVFRDLLKDIDPTNGTNTSAEDYTERYNRLFNEVPEPTPTPAPAPAPEKQILTQDKVRTGMSAIMTSVEPDKRKEVVNLLNEIDPSSLASLYDQVFTRYDASGTSPTAEEKKAALDILGFDSAPSAKVFFERLGQLCESGLSDEENNVIKPFRKKLLEIWSSLVDDSIFVSMDNMNSLLAPFDENTGGSDVLDQLKASGPHKYNNYFGIEVDLTSFQTGAEAVMKNMSAGRQAAVEQLINEQGEQLRDLTDVFDDKYFEPGIQVKAVLSLMGYTKAPTTRKQFMARHTELLGYANALPDGEGKNKFTYLLNAAETLIGDDEAAYNSFFSTPDTLAAGSETNLTQLRDVIASYLNITDVTKTQFTLTKEIEKLGLDELKSLLAPLLSMNKDNLADEREANHPDVQKAILALLGLSSAPKAKVAFKRMKRLIMILMMANQRGSANESSKLVQEALEGALLLLVPDSLLETTKANTIVLDPTLGAAPVITPRDPIRLSRITVDDTMHWTNKGVRQVLNWGPATAEGLGNLSMWLGGKVKRGAHAAKQATVINNTGLVFKVLNKLTSQSSEQYDKFFNMGAAPSVSSTANPDASTSTPDASTPPASGFSGFVRNMYRRVAGSETSGAGTEGATGIKSTIIRKVLPAAVMVEGTALGLGLAKTTVSTGWNVFKTGLRTVGHMALAPIATGYDAMKFGWNYVDAAKPAAVPAGTSMFGRVGNAFWYGTRRMARGAAATTAAIGFAVGAGSTIGFANSALAATSGHKISLNKSEVSSNKPATVQEVVAACKGKVSKEDLAEIEKKTDPGEAVQQAIAALGEGGLEILEKAGVIPQENSSPWISRDRGLGIVAGVGNISTGVVAGFGQFTKAATLGNTRALLNKLPINFKPPTATEMASFIKTVDETAPAFKGNYESGTGSTWNKFINALTLLPSDQQQKVIRSFISTFDIDESSGLISVLANIFPLAFDTWSSMKQGEVRNFNSEKIAGVGLGSRLHTLSPELLEKFINDAKTPENITKTHSKLLECNNEMITRLKANTDDPRLMKMQLKMIQENLKKFFGVQQLSAGLIDLKIRQLTKAKANIQNVKNSEGDMTDNAFFVDALLDQIINLLTSRDASDDTGTVSNLMGRIINPAS